MKKDIVIILSAMIITFIISVELFTDTQPPCTTQRITILEKDLEIEKLSNDLALLTHKIEKLQIKSKTQGEELTKLNNFITTVGGQGGEPTL